MFNTSGPWLYSRIDDITEAIVTNEGDSIFDVRGATPADLNLIVAAPDMLAALQLLMADPYLSDPINNDRMAAARAAIARATS